MSDMVMHPLAEIREWDEALAVLGIQDSNQTPADAIRELNARIEALEAALRNARVSIIAIAAECHVAKCEFDMNDKEPPLKAAVARVLVDKALHRIGDIAIKAMDAALAPGTASNHE